MKKVPPGKYRVTLNAHVPGAQGYYVKSANLGGKDVTDSGFSLNGGTWSLDVVLGSDGATVEGTVLDGKDQPVPNAVVIGLPSPENRNRRDLFKKASSDQHGHFVLRGVRAGQYTMFAPMSSRKITAIPTSSNPTKTADNRCASIRPNARE